MNSEELKQELLSFMLPIYDFSRKETYLTLSKDSRGYVFKFGCQYEAPPLNFSHLKKLSDLFGTDDINVNDDGYSGCETCDWGSNYWNDIIIKNVTKNEEALSVFVGKDLYAV